jgi:hypothetical protein
MKKDEELKQGKGKKIHFRVKIYAKRWGKNNSHKGI